ncbi:MAG TPA: hypothetical protein VFP95_03660 [Gammaproteobacteria bacterium]|nr:hypothetical protein [Gammaproteobacteria bacterium]
MRQAICCLLLLSFPLFVNAAEPVSPLTRAEVANFLQTEIAITHKQKKMRANAAEYEDVIHAFYTWRDQYLVSTGWEIQRFEEVRDRVFTANSALDTIDDLAERKPAREKEIANIRTNTFISSEQKEKMIRATRQIADTRRKQAEQSKADWPAVRAYREEFKQYIEWGAGNVAKPPRIEMP